MTKMICIAVEQLDEIDEPIEHIREIETAIFTLADTAVAGGIANADAIGNSLLVIARSLRLEIARIHGWKETVDTIIDGAMKEGGAP